MHPQRWTLSFLVGRPISRSTVRFLLHLCSLCSNSNTGLTTPARSDNVQQRFAPVIWAVVFLLNAFMHSRKPSLQLGPTFPFIGNSFVNYSKILNDLEIS
jgi:hypothetical protein